MFVALLALASHAVAAEGAEPAPADHAEPAHAESEHADCAHGKCARPDSAHGEPALKLDPVALLQLWGTAYDMDVDPQADATGYGDPEDDPGFKVKRARLGVRAEWEDLKLALVAGTAARYDGFSEDESDFSLYAASIGWDRAYGGVKVGVEAGVQDLPFSQDAQMGSGELTFEERGMAAEHIGEERGTGLVGAVGTKSGAVTGRVGVFNSGEGAFGDDNAGKTLVARVDGKLGGRDTQVLWDPAGQRDGVGVGFGAAGMYTVDVATTTMGADADVVLRAGPVSALAEGSWATLTPTATDVASPEVTDPTTLLGATGEVNVAVGRFQPAARVSYYADSALGSWTQVLGGVVAHVGVAGTPDVIRVGAGYVLRLESDPIPNDTVRLWMQARL